MSECYECKLVAMGKGRSAMCYDCLEERNVELQADKLVLMERDEKYCKTISGLQTANLELQAELAALREKYNDLIMQVATKHPDETRHETAKRYIHNAEHQDNSPEHGEQPLERNPNSLSSGNYPTMDGG